MYNYSTITPYYFDYIASSRTRQEILDDPDLCHYLEDPLLKDNMELAIKYKEARGGTYEKKKEFVEYLICNGPEIDTDTLLYYREKCLQEPVYCQIAEIEFSDMDQVDRLRVDKYGKTVDLSDCFTQPCNYLGPMSSIIGIMGDSNNFRTMPNIFSTLLKGTDQEKKDLQSCWGNIRQHLINKILPNIRQSMQIIYEDMYDKAKEFADTCKKAGLVEKLDIGDKHAIPRADQISVATKVNTYNRLGDCARMWEHMRRFNAYDPTQNSKGPLPYDKTIDNRNTNGAAIDQNKGNTTISQAPNSTVASQAAKGNKKAQAELAMRTFNAPLPISFIGILADSSKSIEERSKLLLERLNVSLKDAEKDKDSQVAQAKASAVKFVQNLVVKTQGAFDVIEKALTPKKAEEKDKAEEKKEKTEEKAEEKAEEKTEEEDKKLSKEDTENKN